MPALCPVPMPPFALAGLLAGSLLLAGCGDGEKERQAIAPASNNDPALTGALADQILVDPDLAGQNEVAAGGALTATDGALPTDNDSPEQIAAARSEALALLGGSGAVRPLPAARAIAAKMPEEAAFTAAARAAASSATGARCADKVRYTAAWAARLPQAFPVYPRGNVQEAAGTDEAGCALRVINFTTPVPLDDVLGFYYTRGLAAGYRTERFTQDGYDMLGGTRGGAAFMLYARRLPTGRTEVDLVTSG
ncbi:hypothetical protein NT2_01_04140 [Caenibius tardaugens NBRC 16725]|uniref:Lipoprotein n=1 Tax=Caenibius tardaugens NBRC 16725 TaxID=1219035 RepID=U2ZYP0_9SPHN|nr:hypothetical protein [Caenibius tardaugens]GAD47643.1 hypothetical protein NT2_01_04140 [Caenibius tardaugens NBRC 16725]